MNSIILLFALLFSFQGGDKNKIKEAEMIFSDHMGNIYVINNNTFIKCRQDLLKTHTYDWQSMGKINQADVTDPMRILLFSESNNSVIYLDNKLSIIAEPFKLDIIGVYDVSSVCTASQGGFWVFDNQSRQILHIDKYGRANVHSGALKYFSILPDKLKEVSNKLYLGYPGKGILVFDEWASYKKTIPLKYENKFIVRKSRIYYQKENKILFYDRLSRSSKIVFDNKQNIIKDFTVKGKNIYYITENNLIKTP